MAMERSLLASGRSLLPRRPRAAGPRRAQVRDDGVAEILAAAAAGGLAALAALLLFGAGGAWATGLGAAAAILLLTGAAIVLLLRREHAVGGSSRPLRTARDLLAGLAVPAALSDRLGRMIASNEAYDAAFGHRAPERLLAEQPAERDRHAILGTLAREGRARGRLAVDGTAIELAAVHLGDYRLWSLMPVAGAEARDGDEPPALGQGSTETLGEVLADLEIGLAIADGEARLVYLNPLLARWLGVAGAGEVPELTRRSLLDPARNEFSPGDGTRLTKQILDGPAGGRLLLLRRPAPAAPGATSGSPDSALMRGLFAAAPVGLAIVDDEGRLCEFNSAFETFAPNRAPRQGERLDSYVAPEDRDAIGERLAAVFAGNGKAKPLEVSFNTQPPRTGQVFVTLLEGRTPPAALVHLIDTTQHKSLERQFVQAQKMQAVGQLAGGVAHDFNNLLTAIIGFCDLLLVRHGPGDQSFSDVMQIKQNANRASNLVRQLLAFSRQQTMRPKVLSVTDVLADLSNLLRRLIGETIELEMIHGRDLGAVRVDQGQLEQVIINLAVNARDAMPEGGTLRIRTKPVGPDDAQVRQYSVMPSGDYVLIEISDTGYGIPPENHNKIFEPFFTTKSVGKGTGLGLSTVYGIIKQTGGFIFVESAPGEGATFRIYLPVHEQAAAEEPRQEGSAPKDLTGKGTVLICEDEDAVRMFAARALENKGYTVLQASSGEEAMELLEDEARRVDLLISDVVMPNMDGPALVEAARKIRRDMAIIFISGYAEDVFRKTMGRSEGDYAFLPKPFSLKQLAEAVKEALE